MTRRAKGVTVQWFARGGSMARVGPFKSQVLAAKAVITPSGHPLEGAFVWPEVTTDAEAPSG